MWHSPDSRALVPSGVATTLLLGATLFAQAPTQLPIAARIDAYIDARFDAPKGATAALLAELAGAGIKTPSQLEALLRAPRHAYPPADALIGRTTVHRVTCLHVDYSSKYHLYVPSKYEPGKPTPLVVVGHGGNSSMSPQRAERVAAMYLRAYAPILSKEIGAIVVAPHTSRGWGQIGNSLLLSTISAVQRQLNVDPDRIYLTGQSMGGHMAFRAALTLGDRFGAVSPHSGGYDFVARHDIANLSTVPGYVTWGKTEPYGINKDSRTNAAWSKSHGLDWVWVEKPGGHEIYADELDDVGRFFAARPRNLYRNRIYLRAGGAMKFVNTWKIKGWPEHTVHHQTKPLRWNLRHWLEVTPRPDHKEPLTVLAKYTGDNEFVVESDQVRELCVHLHPKMGVDLARPVRVVVNGKERFRGKIEPDLAGMLELVREFDDRGRVFWGRVRVAVDDDRKVEGFR